MTQAHRHTPHTPPAPPRSPITASWWVQPGIVLAGPYPGVHRQPEMAMEKLAALLDAGVRTIINLQEPGERRHGKLFPDYVPHWQALAEGRGIEVEASRHPIRDVSVPTRDLMHQVLTIVDQSRALGVIYVHCMGGHGRSATVAGCWLVEQGVDGSAALNAITQARALDPYLVGRPAPESRAQREFVRDWVPRLGTAHRNV